MKIPTTLEISRQDARCEKAMANEVKFFIHSYGDLMTCNNEKLQSVISALNVANADRYNEVRIQYPGFVWDPPPIDINKLVILLQSVYPTQVVEYSLGCGKKSDLDTEGNDNTRYRKLQVCSHLANLKLIVITMMRVSGYSMSSSQLMKSMMGIEHHINHQIGTVITTGPGPGHLKTTHTGKDTDTMLQIEGTGMIAIQAGQIVVIIII